LYITQLFFLHFLKMKKMLKHRNIVDSRADTTITFWAFRYRRMTPHVIVVYECVLERSADVLRQLSSRASLLHAVVSGFNSLSGSFFVSEWKPFCIFDEKTRQKVISFYQPRGCQQKRLRMGFKPMPAPTRDVLWIEVAAILKCRTALST